MQPQHRGVTARIPGVRSHPAKAARDLHQHNQPRFVYEMELMKWNEVVLLGSDMDQDLLDKIIFQGKGVWHNLSMLHTSLWSGLKKFKNIIMKRIMHDGHLTDKIRPPHCYSN